MLLVRTVWGKYTSCATARLVGGMALDDVVQVECAAGCGHGIYSDRGALECPCHWPSVKVSRAALALRLR